MERDPIADDIIASGRTNGYTDQQIGRALDGYFAEKAAGSVPRETAEAAAAPEGFGLAGKARRLMQPVKDYAAANSQNMPDNAIGRAVQYGAETAMNIPQSAAGLVDAPMSILQQNVDPETGVLNIPGAVWDAAKGVWDFGSHIVGSAATTAGQLLRGDVDMNTGLPKAFHDDPVGTVVGGKLVKGAAKGAAPVVAAGVKAAGKAVGKTGEFVAAQTYGLNPETVRTVIKNPDAFSAEKRAGTNRETVFGKVKKSVDKRLEDLSETGKGYEAVRQSGDKVSGLNSVLQKVLDKEKIQIDADGKVVTTSESVPLGRGDIIAIEDFIRQYGADELSANGFMNARTALSNMAKYETGKTDAATRIARDIRSEYDAAGKGAISGLAELDAKYAPEVKLMKDVKKRLFNKDGKVKDTATSSIANLTGKGKEQLRKQIEEVIPGITKDVEILRAIEDIDAASGQKVGTYLRTAIGVGSGVATGSPLLILAGLTATSPKMGVALLRSYGKLKNIPKDAIDSLITDVRPAGSSSIAPPAGRPLMRKTTTPAPPDATLSTAVADAIAESTNAEAGKPGAGTKGNASGRGGLPGIAARGGSKPGGGAGAGEAGVSAGAGTVVAGEQVADAPLSRGTKTLMRKAPEGRAGRPKGSEWAEEGIPVYHGGPNGIKGALDYTLDRVRSGEGTTTEGHGAYFSDLKDVAETYKKSLSSREPGPGYLYRARLGVDADRLLDLDKPLSEQSANVKKALRYEEIGDIADPAGDAANSLFGLPPSKNTVVKIFGETIEGSDTGRTLYHRLEESFGGGAEGQKKASDFFYSAGIPGSKFLDQRSRAKDGGSHNYVIFDDKLIELTHKNGRALNIGEVKPPTKPLMRRAPTK